MSEPAEMYLLRISLLSQNANPVPISLLAETLGVSPISANQMCRKLEGKGLVIYQPYKGVTLTPQGEAIAQSVLRKRRLWEVFLSEKLGLPPEDAEDIACRFEHVTPEQLAERLANFLGQPILSLQQQPIPPCFDDDHFSSARPLATTSVGRKVRIEDIFVDEALMTFLRSHHIAPGVELKVLAKAGKQAVLIESSGQHLSLDFDVARRITVVPLPQPDGARSHTIADEDAVSRSAA